VWAEHNLANTLQEGNDDNRAHRERDTPRELGKEDIRTCTYFTAFILQTNYDSIPGAIDSSMDTK
jgi:hypothetical protein